MKKLSWLGLVVCVVCSCATVDAPTPQAPVDVSQALANLARAPSESSAAVAVDLLSLPENIRHYLEVNIVPLDSEQQRYDALRSWLFQEFGKYHYDALQTYALNELEEEKIINCFSFSNLFVAAAHYLDLDAKFQLVFSPPYWDISNNNWIYNQHINVTGNVRRLTTELSSTPRDGRAHTVGTYIKPQVEQKSYFAYVADLNRKISYDTYLTRELTNAEALSLYYSNKSMEALFEKDMATAFEYTRMALSEDAQSPTAWTNLGVLYSRRGDYELAKEAYLTAVQLDPSLPVARNNLAALYVKMGDSAAASSLREATRGHRQQNPYYHYSLAEQALKEGDLKQSARHIKAAIRRKEDEALFFFFLAQVRKLQADMEDARDAFIVGQSYADGRVPSRYMALYKELRADHFLKTQALKQ